MKLSEIRSLIDDAMAKYGDLEAMEVHTFGDPTPIRGLYVNHAVFRGDAAADGPVVLGEVDFSRLGIGFRRHPHGFLQGDPRKEDACRDSTSETASAT